MNIAIIINSCYKFHKKTIPPIIESAKMANIPLNKIYVVVGESYCESIIIREEYNLVYVKYVNVDYNGVLYFSQTEQGINELKKYTHFFYVHDTAEFMDFFYNKIQNYALNCESYIRMGKNRSQTSGLLNVNWFLNNKKELLNYFINYDINLVNQYKLGDFKNKNLIYIRFNNIPDCLNEDSIFMFDNFKPIGDYFINDNIVSYEEQKYSEKKRLKILFNEPGIVKYTINYSGNCNGGRWCIDL